jgi:hypothetical protein
MSVKSTLVVPSRLGLGSGKRSASGAGSGRTRKMSSYSTLPGRVSREKKKRRSPSQVSRSTVTWQPNRCQAPWRKSQAKRSYAPPGRGSALRLS